MALGVLPAVAEPIQLRPAEYVQANAASLDVGDQAIPCVADWNGDGLKDLTVGYRYADKVALYLNCGTAQQPAFTNFVNLQAGGADIYHYGGLSGCGAPAPWVCDYDADGKRDLLVGTGAEGYVYFYRNTNTDAQPILTSGVQLLMNGSVLSVPGRATPYVHDWDGDGLNDLLCGDANGNVHFFKNVGTARAPVYTSDSLLQAGGAVLNSGYRSAIRVCDWDGDGIKDLICSASDYAGWCKNVGNNSSPQLNAPVRLQAPGAGAGLINIDTGYRMRLEVVDWNNDGVMDLLIGNYDGRVFYYEGYHFAVRNPVWQPDRRAIALQWNSADYLKYNVLAGGDPRNITTITANNVPSGGKITAWTNACPENAQFYRITIAP